MAESDLRRPSAVAFGRGKLHRFVPRTKVLDEGELSRAIKRMAHEVIERNHGLENVVIIGCLLYTSPSPRDKRQSRMPSSA